MKIIKDSYFGKEEIANVAAEIAELTKEYPICLFMGEVGAGKTTLIKAICVALGVRAEMSSPTFSLVNEYESVNRTIYHMDLYRLETQREAFEAGITEYLDSGDICLIEWPEIIMDLLLGYKVLIIELDHSGETRKIKMSIQD